MRSILKGTISDTKLKDEDLNCAKCLDKYTVPQNVKVKPSLHHVKKNGREEKSIAFIGGSCKVYSDGRAGDC
jgi:hypothetical protein